MGQLCICVRERPRYEHQSKYSYQAQISIIFLSMLKFMFNMITGIECKDFSSRIKDQAEEEKQFVSKLNSFSLLYAVNLNFHYNFMLLNMS